jgi:hypothetical protein
MNSSRNPPTFPLSALLAPRLSFGFPLLVLLRHRLHRLGQKVNPPDDQKLEATQTEEKLRKFQGEKVSRWSRIKLNRVEWVEVDQKGKLDKAKFVTCNKRKFMN